MSILTVKPGDYPELRLKAWTSRVLTSFISVCLQDLCNRLPNDQVDQELMLATVALTKMSDWILLLERTPRYMTRQQATALEDLSWELPCFDLEVCFLNLCFCFLVFTAKALEKNNMARFLDTYQQLALWTAQRSILRWPFKPKFHVTGHRFQDCTIFVFPFLFPFISKT